MARAYMKLDGNLIPIVRHCGTVSKGETWLMNGNINQEPVHFDLFNNNRLSFTIMRQFQVLYVNNEQNILVYNNFAWSNYAYQTITLEQPATGDLLT